MGNSENVVRRLREAVTAVHASDALVDYVRLLWKRKWLILSLMVVVTSLVAIQMYRLPSIYQATTQMTDESGQAFPFVSFMTPARARGSAARL